MNIASAVARARGPGTFVRNMNVMPTGPDEGRLRTATYAVPAKEDTFQLIAVRVALSTDLRTDFVDNSRFFGRAEAISPGHVWSSVRYPVATFLLPTFTKAVDAVCCAGIRACVQCACLPLRSRFVTAGARHALTGFGQAVTRSNSRCKRSRWISVSPGVAVTWRMR